MNSKAKVILFISQFLHVILISVAQTDLTLQPKTYGVDVVNAVSSKIRLSNIFTDDNRFVIRAAYVETKFGLDPKTYRPDYFGGIWQINEDIYNATKLSSPETQSIQEKFGIDWINSSWQDLEKPLFSGLALRLFMNTQSTVVPDTIARQAEYWKQHFNTDGNLQEFIDAVRTLESENVCSGRMDLVTILDGSTSVESANFETAKSFVADLVSSFSLESVQIAFIVYSSTTSTIFPLTNNLSADEMKSSILNTDYPRGGTLTNLAIDSAVEMLPSVNGAVPRVITVFTDGESNQPAETIVSARKAKEAGIISFSVGIGPRIGMAELLVIAGDNPNNVISSSSFDALIELPYRLNADTCTVPQKPPINGTIGDSVAQNETRYFSYGVPTTGITLDVEVSTGETHTFYSYSFPTPSAAINDGIIDGPTFINHPDDDARIVKMIYQEASEVNIYVAVQGLKTTNNFTIVTIEGNSVPTTTVLPETEPPTTAGAPFESKFGLEMYIILVTIIFLKM